MQQIFINLYINMYVQRRTEKMYNKSRLIVTVKHLLREKGVYTLCNNSSKIAQVFHFSHNHLIFALPKKNACAFTIL